MNQPEPSRPTEDAQPAFSAAGLLDDAESQCGKPCDPDTNCPECEGYWERMSREGYWDLKKHRWTEKGWISITRVI